MTRKQVLTVLVALLGVVQLAVPISMIVRRERTLAEGELFKFRCEPVDPYDAFRGRYVRLGVEDFAAPWPTDEEPRELRYGRRAYASVATGEDGFARVTGVSSKRPPEGHYITTRVRYRDEDRLLLDFPLDRFYMPEDQAPAAEKAYWEHSSAQRRDAYITVRVKDGFPVLEDLYVAGVPIATFLARSQGEEGEP